MKAKKTKYVKSLFNVFLINISAEMYEYIDRSGYLLRIYHAINDSTLFQKKFETKEALYSYVNYYNSNEAQALNTLLYKTRVFKTDVDRELDKELKAKFY